MTVSPDALDTSPLTRTGWAFSTLGCPGSSLAEVIEVAHRHGIDAVEMRISPSEFLRPTATPAEIAGIRAETAEAGIRIVSVTSRSNIAADGLDVEDLRRHLTIADTIGAGGLRVFMGGGDEDRAFGRIADVADVAERGGRILVETHDSHSTGASLVALFTRLDRAGLADRCGIIWDAAHSWAAGESPAQTLDAISPWLAYVQVKDVFSRRNPVPVLPGAGVYPIGDLAAALEDRRCTISLEWERRWFPELAPLDTALTALASWASALRAQPPRGPLGPESVRS